MTSSPSLAPPDSPADAPTTFADLGLPAPLLRTLATTGIEAPFPIQQAAIPDVLAGRDVLGRGRTGSGKTLAFGLPLLTLLARDHARRPIPGSPVALVLAPTRELALQIAAELTPHAAALRLTLTTVVGGESYKPQVSALERGVHLLVATPGRLTDLLGQRACTLTRVKFVVLDEADQMADTGFLPDVIDLMSKVDPNGQRLLFSATLDARVQTVVDRFMRDPVQHSADPATATVPDMDHVLFAVRPGDKRRVTAEIASRGGRTILFVRSRIGAERTADELRAAGVPAVSLHGGLSQALRNRTLADFKSGRSPVLVATDVAARGIHVADIDLVLHVDPPADHRDYLHRAGRTARAGAAGTVVTLALPNQVPGVEGLMRTAGIRVSAVPARPGSPELADLLSGGTGARSQSPQVPTVRTPTDGGIGASHAPSSSHSHQQHAPKHHVQPAPQARPRRRRRRTNGSTDKSA